MVSQDVYIHKSIQDILQHAQQSNTPIISSATKTRIEEHLRRTRPVYSMEIWAAIGHSTLTIAHTVQQRNGRLISCEVSLPSYRFVRRIMHENNVHNTTIYHGDATRIQRESILAPESIDFVFIDGTKREYYLYIQIVRPFVKKWGYIICDDVIQYQNKVGDLLSYITQQWGTHETVQLDDHDGLLVVRRLQ